MSETSAERVARNQALFREVNERIEELAESAAVALGGLDAARAQHWVCECYRVECVARLSIDIAEYEAVRSRPNHFIIAPGEDHVHEEHEHVVTHADAYWVVAKVGEAGAVSAELDPR